jgi:alpha-tubulin suppressor-like RCC1 family protein
MVLGERSRYRGWGLGVALGVAAATACGDGDDGNGDVGGGTSGSAGTAGSGGSKGGSAGSGDAGAGESGRPGQGGAAPTGGSAGISGRGGDAGSGPEGGQGGAAGARGDAGEGGAGGDGGSGPTGPCDPNPCLHQGACTPVENGVACTCTAGYLGDRCQDGEGLRFTSVSDGQEHVCGLLRNGRIDCRGDNRYGQASPPPGVFTQVTAATHRTCALRANGEVVCFGMDRYGASSPPAGSFVQLSSGAFESCGVRTDGSVTCWGERTTFPYTGTFRQVAVGGWDDDGLIYAIRTDGTLASFHGYQGTYSYISASVYHACAIDPSGTVSCWGGNYSFLPWQPPQGMWTIPGPFVKVSSAHDRSKSCGLKENGDVACWEVQPVVPDPFGGPTPRVVTTNYPGPYIDIDTEEEELCAVRGDGTIGCTYDETGRVPAGLFTEYDAGWSMDCGILPDRSVSCFDFTGRALTSYSFPGPVAQVASGAVTCGISPDGSAMTASVRNAVVPPSGTFTHIASGYPLFREIPGCCAVRLDGALVCWDSDGEVAAPSGTFTRVSLSAQNGCAVRTDGSIHCWGENRLSQSSPSAGSFSDVSTGPNHACAIRTDGSLACWGRNDNGEATPPAGTFTHVSAAGGHTCALRTDGQVLCFGSNGSGQTNAPPGTFTRVTVGGTHSCALAEDQSLTCWGDRSWGYSPL